MRREMFLFITALLFTAGNLTAAYLCGSNVHGYWHPSVAAAVATVLTAVILPFCIKCSRLTFLLFPLLGATGYLCMETMRPDVRGSLLRDGRSVDIQGIITDGGRSSSGNPFLEVAVGNENTIIYNVPDNVPWMPGDSVHAAVRCSRVSNFSEDFDYQGYMGDRGIFYTCFCGKYSTINVITNASYPLRVLPARLRWKFSAAVDAALPSEGMAQTRAVVKALAYGYQDEIPADIEESFRQSGAIHLLALSGMHLGLLYGLLLKLLAFTGNSPAARRVRSIIIILALWAFTIFTGCGVSILRAAVMFSIYEAGALGGRRRSGLNALSLSAIIITIADPSAPSGISFQLSYAAMTAIFLIFPYLRGIVTVRNKALGKIADACAMTIACQATTAPIIMLHFGTFAFFSLLANLLCAPIVSVAMLLIPSVMIIQDTANAILGLPSRILETAIDVFIRINATISNL